MHLLFFRGQESSGPNTIPIAIEQQLEMNSDESTVETMPTTLITNGPETSSAFLIDKIHCEQIADNIPEIAHFIIPEIAHFIIKQDPYIIFKQSLENFVPNDIGDLTKLALSHQLPINDALKFVDILFEEAIKNSEHCGNCVGVIKKQQKFIINHFQILCTDLIVKLRMDFIANKNYDNDDLRKQAEGVGTLIGELFNQYLLTWQNIEGHLQRLMANGFNSTGTINIAGNIFYTCGAKLRKIMPGGCLQSLYKTFENKCSKIPCNAVSVYNIKRKTYQQLSIYCLLEKAVEYQHHTQLTFVDFKKMIIQQKPSYEIIINHLNNVNINEDLDKYVNLIVSEILKKPAMTKTYTNVLNEMRLKSKKQDVMELTLYNSLQTELTKYSKMANRNLKVERPEMQLKAQILGNFICELQKMYLINTTKIEGLLNTLLKQPTEGSSELVYNIIQSCGSKLHFTLGTNEINNYIFQLKINTNPLNMSHSICTKVNSIRNYRESNNTRAMPPSVSPLKEVNKQNEITVQPSIPQSNTANASQLSNTDELLQRLKRLQEL